MKDTSLQRMSLYNLEWQVLRVNLDFRTLKSVKESCAKLIAYLAAPLRGYDTRSNRLYRVNNLLNATVMGINGRLVRASTEKAVELREMIVYVQECRAQYEAETSTSKDFKWDEIRETLDIQMALSSDLAMVLFNLRKRVKFAKDTKKVDVNKTRPELLKYVGMLNTELTRREMIKGGFGIQ